MQQHMVCAHHASYNNAAYFACQNTSKDQCYTGYLAVTSPAFLQVGNDQFYEVLEKVSGQKGIDDWAKLQKLMEPLAKAATAVPPIAIRADPGVALTAIARYLPRLFSGGPDALKLIGPFSKVTPCSELLHSLLLQLICIAIH